jgi:hypothetical protein
MIPLPFAGDDRLRTAAAPACRWFTAARVWQPAGIDALSTGDEETAVVLLHGTFDLQADGTAWPARGARTTPFAGRPMAVFLPPRATFRAAGSGEILLIGARQPDAEPPATGRAALSRQPLLPLAGSGKAFDPNTGEWMPAETFPTSAESLPPRRMQQLAAGAATIERVLAPDYKAATISVDEVVLPPHATLRLCDVPSRPPADELLLFVRTMATADVTGSARHTVRGDGAFVLRLARGNGDVAIAAGASPCYVALAYGGKA